MEKDRVALACNGPDGRNAASEPEECSFVAVREEHDPSTTVGASEGPALATIYEPKERNKGRAAAAPVPLGEADVALPADDDVIENRDPADVADLAEPTGVVVAEGGSSRAGPDEGPKGVPRMNLDARQAPTGKHPVHDDAVPSVDGDDPELLDGEEGEAGAHVDPDLCGTGEPLADLRPAGTRGGGDQLALEPLPSWAFTTERDTGLEPATFSLGTR
jgi:hypothetical protein